MDDVYTERWYETFPIHYCKKMFCFNFDDMDTNHFFQWVCDKNNGHFEK